jgi:hypothetical protein
MDKPVDNSVDKWAADRKKSLCDKGMTAWTTHPAASKNLAIPTSSRNVSHFCQKLS